MELGVCSLSICPLSPLVFSSKIKLANTNILSWAKTLRISIARMTYSRQNLEIKGKGICEVPLFIFWSRAGEPTPEIPEELQGLPWFRYEGAVTDDELDEIHCSCCG